MSFVGDVGDRHLALTVLCLLRPWTAVANVGVTAWYNRKVQFRPLDPECMAGLLRQRPSSCFSYQQGRSGRFPTSAVQTTCGTT